MKSDLPPFTRPDGLIRRTARRLRPRRPLVRQYDQSDCGPTCLLSVLRYWGGDASLVRVRELAKTDAQGSTLLSLYHAAGSLGFEAEGARGGYDDLRSAPLPCVAHVVVEERMHHFVVVYAVEEHRLLVADPARGKRWMPRAEFESVWKDNAVLLLRPTERLSRTPAPHWMRWIGTYLRREEAWLSQSAFLGLAYAVLGLLTALFVQLLIDRFIPEHDRKRIVATGMVLFALLLLRAAAGYLRQRFLLQLNKRVSVGIATEFLTHLFRLPAQFFDTRRTGDITARLNDGVKIQSAVLRLVGATIIDVLMVVGSLAFMFVLAPSLGRVALVTVPVYGAILLLATRRLKAEQHEVMKGYAQLESSYIDSLDGVEEIRAFSAGPIFSHLNTLLFRSLADKTERLGLTQARVSCYAELAGGALMMATLVYGAVLVIGGGLQLGGMMGAYSLLATLLPAITRLVEANVALQGASVAATRLMDMLLVEPEPRKGALPFRMQRALHVRGGGFSWPRGGTLFHDVDLSLPRGRLTALCGRSGAGKSTLVGILERKYALTTGELRVDDVSASSVDLEAYRAGIAVVPEKVKIFSGTLAENLLMGRSVPGVEWLVQYVEEMGFGDFMKRFEAGIFTPVGEETRHLSSGERQIVGVLRALLASPAVLVMDEGMNAIDAEIAEMILRSLTSYAADHAVLLISHNLRSLLRADHLYLLENGTVEASGSPAELLARDSAFRTLWRSAEGSTVAAHAF